MGNLMFTVLLVVMFVAISWFACYAVANLAREDPELAGAEPAESEPARHERPAPAPSIDS